MIAFEGAAPNEDEVAAIVAAIASFDTGGGPTSTGGGPHLAGERWKIANRRPELEIDDLRSLVK